MTFAFAADATMCLSFAARPSRFGYALFNSAFQASGLNWFYKPVQITSEAQLANAVAGLRGLDVRGCGVSMPWKSLVVPLLDDLDPAARAIGAINTIVNEHGRLIGHNTDAWGAERVLAEHQVGPGTRVTLLGAGGVAAAIAFALQRLGAQVKVSARRGDAAQRLAARFDARTSEWSERGEGGDVVINATPIGMTPEPSLSPLEESQLRGFALVADLVSSPPESRLISAARAAGQKVVAGPRFTFEQAVRQFELYTGEPAPRGPMQRALNELVK